MAHQWIKIDTLWILNMVLDRDEALRRAVLQGIVRLGDEATSAVKTLGAIEPDAVTPLAAPQVTEDQSQTNQMRAQILDFFKSNPTYRGGLTGIRTALKIDPKSKPFKVAIVNLVTAKLLNHNGKRGVGSEYWIGKP